MRSLLEPCALGSRLFDLQNKYHRNHASIGIAIKYFCDWMQVHWGYLLHDHLEFYLSASRDAIVNKLRVRILPWAACLEYSTINERRIKKIVLAQLSFWVVCA